MILTITLNPAVDISYKLDKFSLDTVNRVADVTKTAGGKGINVARVLRQLSEEVGATGFLGGSLGDFIRTELRRLGIVDSFIEIASEIRNCIAVIHQGQQTEILEAGPAVTGEEAAVFLEKFETTVQQVHMVTISGSIPKGLPAGYYTKMIDIANRYNVKVLVDTNGTLLTDILMNEEKPYLIKPNKEELSELLGLELTDEAQIIDAVQSSLFTDIPWVVVTLGADGALIKQGTDIYRVFAPKVNAVNPVGSGDSVIAGFAAGILRELTDGELMKFSLAMGVLNAMEEKTAAIDVSKKEQIIERMKVKKIK
ncbi:tagatose-6-phosphate kinase [Sporosarcina sp. BI001-red]|uniref:hexose kinase n=1 Tax=Sporosarcina sp. BI001-red TaxID=2282866 RepID=UPI000E273108|nr:hexose kinase [Sporosarcina sp. BI001-red]REB10108.1 tagatose-6-phosphate kinase [Sporosarcina sp. BI001-red]